MRELIAQEAFIASQIYFIRGQKVIFDSDLAQLYGVSTSRLNEQIKRNINRFPSDFMFQLTEAEFKNLISQNAISSWGGRRKLPLVFTEHGALMAASVLNSQAAIDAGIFIVRAFVKMRQMLSTYQELFNKIETLESRYDEQFQDVFAALQELAEPASEPRELIGFKKYD
jgi:hypothetical protein